MTTATVMTFVRLQPIAVLEASLYAYLLTIPFGPAIAPFARHAILVALVVSMGLVHFLPAAPSGRPAAYGLLPFFLLLAVSHGLSILFSSNPSLSLASSTYAPVAALIFFATQDVVTTPPAFRRISIVLTATVLLVGIDGAWQALTDHSFLTGQSRSGDRVRAGAPHPNDIAIIPILIPFVLVVLADLRRRLLFVIGLAVLPLVVVALIASQSRNAWLGLVTAVAVWLALTQRRRTGVVVLAAAAALIVIAYALDLSNVRSRLASLLALHRDGRVGLWIVAWQMFVEAPFFGKGVHVFQDFYPSYLSKVSLPRGYRPEVGYIPWAHNIYLELLAERGLLGLATFATLVVAAAKRVWLCLTPGPIASRRLYAAALASSGATILVMALFDLTFLKDWVCLIFCLLIALCARLPYAFTAPGEPAKTTRPRQPGG